jgi:uncharacterized protein (DUF2236 family)
MSPDPSSVSRRVSAHRVVLIGWARAILMQLAHPLVAAGVYDHSTFRASPMAAATRLQQTVRAMLALTFGSEDDQRQAMEGIRAIHRRVRGRLADTAGVFTKGTPYSAEDPDLVLWVHATLVESFPLAYERFVRPLSEADRDRYCVEAVPTALALGARAADVPDSWARAREYLGMMYGSGAIVVTPQARELSNAVLAPALARLAPPVAWGHRLVTTGLLPDHLRQQYGLRWTPGRQRLFDALVPTIRSVAAILPARLALWPEARRYAND